jgi:hypothetical protein
MNARKSNKILQGSEIQELWSSSQYIPIIQHPKLGDISPYRYRELYAGKRCCLCQKRMVFGTQYRTGSKQEAILRGYEYSDRNGVRQINRAGRGRDTNYFHENYVTLDHKINKARCPELMFDYDNLQAMCWRCNQEKGDDNFFELEQEFEYVENLALETLKRYCPDKLKGDND